jgi:hypothetical protein
MPELLDCKPQEVEAKTFLSQLPDHSRPICGVNFRKCLNLSELLIIFIMLALNRNYLFKQRHPDLSSGI